MDHDLRDDGDLDRVAVLDPTRGHEPTPAQQEQSLRKVTALIAHRERRKGRQRRLIIGVAAAVLAAGAAVAVPNVVPTGQNSAYASWTPIPHEPSSSQVGSMAQSCARFWSSSGSPAVTAGEVLLAERRGDTALLIMWLANGPLIECVLLEPGKATGASVLADRPGQEPALPSTNRVTIESIGSNGPHARAYSEAIGRADRLVTGVDILLPNGTRVQASIRNGWWTAWWPGPEGGVANGVQIQIHTSSGSETFAPDQLYQ